MTALLEELGLGRHRALLDENEFEMDSLQMSTAADLVEIGLPPSAATAIVAHFKPAQSRSRNCQHRRSSWPH